MAEINNGEGGWGIDPVFGEVTYISNGCGYAETGPADIERFARLGSLAGWHEAEAAPADDPMANIVRNTFYAKELQFAQDSPTRGAES